MERRILLQSLYVFVFVALNWQALWGNASSTFWSPPSILSPANAKKRDLSLSINSRGDAVVGWYRANQKKLEIAEYDLIRDKLHVPTIAYPCEHKVKLLKVILAENRDVFVMWLDEKESCIKVCKYLAQQCIWTTSLIMQGAASVIDPILKIDAAGNAMLVWTKYNGYEHQVYGVYFSSKNNSWSSPSALSPIGYDCRLQKFVFDKKGNGVAVWKAILFADSNNSRGVQAARFDASSQKWSQSLLFSDFLNEYVPTGIDISFDSNDNLVFIWNSAHLTKQSQLFQFVSYNSAERKWGNKTLIAAKGNVKNPILVNNHQQLFAIWQETIDGNDQLQSICLNYPGSYLSEKKEISSPVAQIVDYQCIADQSGKIYIIFSDGQQLKIIQYDDMWQEVAQFDDQREIKNLQIQSDALGNTVAMWEKEQHTYYARGDYLLPPSLFSARILEKRFAAKSALRVELSWTLPTSPTVKGYKIRRNEELIATVPANQCRFIDKGLPNGQIIYTICTVNDKNRESRVSELIIRN